MPKGSETLTNARREEIINACEKLYETMSFKEVTIKEIGQATTFTRTSIIIIFKQRKRSFWRSLSENSRAGIRNWRKC